MVEYTTRLSGDVLRPAAFRFSREEKLETLRDLRFNPVGLVHFRLLRDIERLIGRHALLSDQRPEKNAAREARDQLDRLREQFVRLAEQLDPRVLKPDARLLLDTCLQAILPRFALRLVSRLPAYRRERVQDRFVRATADSLQRVAAVIEVASQAARKAARPGRPPEEWRDAFVLDLLRAFELRLGHLPPATRNKGFEHVVGKCLAHGGYPVVDGAHELILKARKRLVVG